MNFSHCDMVFCTLDGKPIRAMEGLYRQRGCAAE